MTKWIMLCLALLASACTDSQAPRYKDGLPVNCPAIVEANIQGVRDGRWSQADALHSIDRNCGPNGYSRGR